MPSLRQLRILGDDLGDLDDVISRPGVNAITLAYFVSKDK
jgi:hypothetical protein